MVLELTLGSKVVACGEPVEGQIALRDGHKEKFDAIVLCLSSIRTIHLGRGDVRTLDAVHGIKVPADALRGGQTIPFRLPAMPDAPPTFRSPAISHDVAVRIALALCYVILSSDDSVRVSRLAEDEPHSTPFYRGRRRLLEAQDFLERAPSGRARFAAALGALVGAIVGGLIIGITMLGRASGRHYLAFTGKERIVRTVPQPTAFA